MARNHGKRPGSSSAPKPKHTDQAGKPTQVAERDGNKATTSAAAPLKQSTSAVGGDKAAKGQETSINPSASSSGGTVSSRVPTAGAAAAGATDAKAVTASTSPKVTKDTTSALGKNTANVVPPAGSPGAGASSSGGSGGFWSGFLGGLIGGSAIAAVAAFYVLGQNGLQTPAQMQSVAADLDRRLSGAESELEEAAGRLTAIENSAEANGGDTVALTDRLNVVAEQLAGLEDKVASAAASQEVTVLAEQLAGLEDKVASAAASQEVTGAAVAALESTLPGFETALAGTGMSIDETRQRTRALDEIVTSIQQVTERLGDDVSALSERVGDTESELEFISGEYHRAAAMLVAIGDIDRSIAQAEPYETALESLRALGLEDPEIIRAVASLEPMAAAGVLTLVDLQESFGSVSSRILLAGEGDQSLVDQMSDNVFGIINMRPAGAEAEGDGNHAIVARAQARLAESDLSATIEELRGLSSAAAEPAAAWLADANARLSADAAIADLRDHAQRLLAEGS